jgi:acetolactate synthase-1/2/3 large subunit
MGAALAEALASAAPHDVLGLRGFAIGQGLPLATGAGMAGPRPVVCLEADGSALYTLSALWTQAREGLDVTTVILDNGGYAILRRESRRLLGAQAIASPLFDLHEPKLDFVALAAGMGVPASRAETSGELSKQFAAALREPGPHLIHAVVPSLY